MTREEAVDVLKALMKNPLFSEVHKVALNIAIHDIKQRHDWDINNLILINKENYEPQSFEWCDTCKEYDQENHCCHRWAKVIRNTVEEMKQGYESEVLDKIKDEIKQYQSDYDVHGTEYDRTAWKSFNRCLQIIDKYKAESEDKE